MKKYFLGSFALVLAIAFTAFTTNKNTKSVRGIVYFSYSLDDVLTEGNLEAQANWSFSSTAPSSCVTGNGTCFIAIQQSAYSGFNGSSEVEKLQNYLIAQTGDAGEYSNAVAAVSALRTTKEI